MSNPPSYTPRVIAMADPKGGSGKTTSTAFLAHTFSALPRNDSVARLRILIVDTDPQGSISHWRDDVPEWRIPVIGMASNTLHRTFWGAVDPARWDVIVIDTPPSKKSGGIVASVLQVATDVIVPLAPTMIELREMVQIFPMIDEAAGSRDADPLVSILLNRVIRGGQHEARSTRAVRDSLTSQNRYVMGSVIPRREDYAQAYGLPVPTDDDAYGSVARELIAGWSL